MECNMYPNLIHLKNKNFGASSPYDPKSFLNGIPITDGFIWFMLFELGSINFLLSPCFKKNKSHFDELMNHSMKIWGGHEKEQTQSYNL